MMKILVLVKYNSLKSSHQELVDWQDATKHE
jgi:hypothetical protein